MLLCKNLRVDLHSSELRISRSIRGKHSQSKSACPNVPNCPEFNSNHNEGYNKKPWISEDTVDISRAALHTIFNQSSRAHTNTNMQSYAGEELFVVLRPFLEGQFGDLHNGGAGLWKSAQAVIFTLALSMWSVIGHTDSRSSRTCISNGGIISDIQHRGSYGFCIKIPLPEGARCVYMGLRFLLLSSASPYANTCSICKRIIFLQGYLERGTFSSRCECAQVAWFVLLYMFFWPCGTVWVWIFFIQLRGRGCPHWYYGFARLCSSQ